MLSYNLNVSFWWIMMGISLYLDYIIISHINALSMIIIIVLNTVNWLFSSSCRTVARDLWTWHSATPGDLSTSLEIWCIPTKFSTIFLMHRHPPAWPCLLITSWSRDRVKPEGDGILSTSWSKFRGDTSAPKELPCNPKELEMTFDLTNAEIESLHQQTYLSQ